MQNNYHQTNQNQQQQNFQNYQIRNFYLSHKIFPKSEISKSEVHWNSVAPRFEYELSMPFVVNQQTAEMLDKGAFVLELWHKSTTEDELLGTTKLDLFPIIDSLRINDDTLSIIPISRNLQPLIIYDGNYPVFDYDSFSNIYFLDLTVAVGTTAQINNYVRKNKGASQRLLLQQSQYNSAYSGAGTRKQAAGSLNNYTNSETLKNPGSIMDYNIYSNNNNNYGSNYNHQQQLQQQQMHNFGLNNNYNDNFNNFRCNNGIGKNNNINYNNNFNNNNNNEINDDEIFEINNLMNNNNNTNNNKNAASETGAISNTNFAKFDVEKFLENNRLELDQINSKEPWSSDNSNTNKNQKDYTNPFTPSGAAKNQKENLAEKKQSNVYENPFIVNTNTNPNNNTNLNLSELPPNFKSYENNNNNNYNVKEKNYQISKESNFYIDHGKDNASGNNKENAYKLNKLSDTEFFKSGGKNLLKSIENNDINPEFDQFQQFKIEGGLLNDMSKFNNNNDNRSSENNNKEKDLQNHFNNLNTESKGDTTHENPFGGNYQNNAVPRFNSAAEGN